MLNKHAHPTKVLRCVRGGNALYRHIQNISDNFSKGAHRDSFFCYGVITTVGNSVLQGAQIDGRHIADMHGRPTVLTFLNVSGDAFLPGKLDKRGD